MPETAAVTPAVDVVVVGRQGFLLVEIYRLQFFTYCGGDYTKLLCVLC